MKIYELPAEIQNRVFALQTAAGNSPNPELELITKEEEGNFDWHKTIESFRFWNSINLGYYKIFYNKYPNRAVKAFSPSQESPSFSEYLTGIILKEVPIFLSEGAQEDLKKTILSVFEGYEIDRIIWNKIEIENNYKRKMRERYSDLCNLLDDKFPEGQFSKDKDGDIFGINVMLKKFICEIGQLQTDRLKENFVKTYFAKSAMSPDHSKTWLELVVDEALLIPEC